MIMIWTCGYSSVLQASSRTQHKNLMKSLIWQRSVPAEEADRAYEILPDVLSDCKKKNQNGCILGLDAVIFHF